MQTMLKAFPIVLLLGVSTASAQSSTGNPQVPAITTALNINRPPPASTTQLATSPQQGSPGAAPIASPTLQPTAVPTPIKYEHVSPRVVHAREKFDNNQRAQVAEYIAEARQSPTSTSTTNIGGQTVFSYRPGALYTVYVGAGRITDIALQPGEQLTGEVQGGDTVRWLISQATAGAEGGEQVHIILKAIDAGLINDVFIPTNRRTYLLSVRSVADWHMPSVSWSYPIDTWKQQKITEAKRESVVPVSAMPEALNFNYSIDGRKRNASWRPVQVFDDGKQTYIRMPANLNATDAPALFIIENGDPLMVNYRVRGVADGSAGPTYVVDRLFDRAELRVGAKNAITIRRH